MHIIDFHTHIYPNAIAHKAAASIRDFYQLSGDDMNGTAEMLLRQGDIASIEKFVILPVGLKPSHVRHINEFSVQQASEQPRFIGFGTIHAGMDNLLEEVEFIQNANLHGIKMHPDTQLFAIDDARLFPVYDMLQDQLPIIFHMGDPRYDYSHPERLRRILKLFPHLRVIAAHFGGYSMYETAYDILKDQPCMFDISSTMMFMDEGIAEKYIKAYGTDRMLFGSDYPLWDPVTEVQRFLKLKLPSDQLEQIAFKNAEQILYNCVKR